MVCFFQRREEQIWVATFSDVTKYIRERENTIIESEMKGKSIKIHISNNLEASVYDIPITLKTYIPKNWKSISINKDKIIFDVKTDKKGNYITYSVLPSESSLILEEVI